jgi:hypothetical protein
LQLASPIIGTDVSRAIVPPPADPQFDVSVSKLVFSGASRFSPTVTLILFIGITFG